MSYHDEKPTKGSFLVVLSMFIVLFSSMISSQTIPLKSPDEYFGFKPGAERMLFTYDELAAYLKQLDDASNRVKMVDIGKSPMGKTMYIAFISSEQNISRLEELKAINKRLALDGDIPGPEREELIGKARVFVLSTLSMHAEEVGPSQASPLIAYRLANSTDPQELEWLDKVVLMVVPSHNPDGMDMEVNHYKKSIGTKYEGSPYPGVYHKYVGHDNNRDFVTLSQDDNRAVAAIYNLDWFPQVMVEKHQMGYRGMRYFVPPNHDPIAENIDAGIYTWIGIFGANMMKDMTGENLSGVSQHTVFDSYWIGSTETCMWKNVIGFLTEAASSKYATPIYVEPNELMVYGKGLSEYKKSINMPLPWPGGWWKLSDIVQYEIVSLMSVVKTAAQNSRDILQFRNDLCRKEIQNGKTLPPYYYILPQAQHDQSEVVNLVNLMRDHGVYVFRLKEDLTIKNTIYKKGDIVIPLSQPFRAFIKEVMEPQRYPERHYTPGGEIIKPYDVASWSLPLHRGLTAVEINQPSIIPQDFDSKLEKIDSYYQITRMTGDIPGKFYAALFPVNFNDSFRAAFSALKQGLTVHRLNTSLVLDGTDYPAGSFVVFYDEKNPTRGQALKSIIKDQLVTPKIMEKSQALDTKPVKLPRIALVETYFHDMDAGWTRFIFDTYQVPYTIIRPGEIAGIDFKKMYDLVIFPDSGKDILMSGKMEEEGDYFISNYPPEYRKGTGKEGLNRLMQFVDNGGIILAWGGSPALFMGPQEIPSTLPGKPADEFQLPIQDMTRQAQKAGLVCPGSWMKVNLLENHPITWGMPKDTGIYFQGGPVFNTAIPELDMDRRVIGVFPEKNILLSGYCEKEELIGNKPVLVWVKKNKGQLVLMGFSPQFRASTQAAYKLLFNSILLPSL